MVRCWIILVMLAVLAQPACSQETGVGDPTGELVPALTRPATAEAPAPPMYGGDLWTRPKLSGDWFGARPTLAERGVTLAVDLTQFYQGVTSGGLNQAFEYGGKVDYFFNVDGQKAGLWQGSFLSMHTETRYGQSIEVNDGLISSANVNMLFPVPGQDITAITGLKLTQAINENLVVYAGKINTLDEYALPYAGGRGINAFMNSSFTYNPIQARTIPYSTPGAGLTILREQDPLATFIVFDAVDHPTTAGIDDWFEQGAVLYGLLRLPVAPFGLPGHQCLGGVWSSREYVSFSPEPYLDIPGQGLVTGGTVAGSWSLFYSFDQALWVDPDNAQRRYGLFGQTGLSDGEANPVVWCFSAGIGGSCPLPRRPADTFGLGYYYLGLSDDFKALLNPVLPERDEHGFELFYNLAATPWCHITADLQAASPSIRALDTAVIFGLRAKLDF